MTETPIILSNQWSRNQFPNDLIDNNKEKYKQILIKSNQNSKQTRWRFFIDQATLTNTRRISYKKEKLEREAKNGNFFRQTRVSAGAEKKPMLYNATADKSRECCNFLSPNKVECWWGLSQVLTQKTKSSSMKGLPRVNPS